MAEMNKSRERKEFAKKQSYDLSLGWPSSSLPLLSPAPRPHHRNTAAKKASPKKHTELPAPAPAPTQPGHPPSPSPAPRIAGDLDALARSQNPSSGSPPLRRLAPFARIAPRKPLPLLSSLSPRPPPETLAHSPARSLGSREATMAERKLDRPSALGKGEPPDLRALARGRSDLPPPLPAALDWPSAQICG